MQILNAVKLIQRAFALIDGVAIVIEAGFETVGQVFNPSLGNPFLTA
jgi:hypothetical protein